MDGEHRTEAACLLEQGATYKRRVGLTPCAAPGDPIFAGFKPGAFSLYFGDAPIYHFDLDGRWQRAFVDGTHFLKGLDATVQTIDRVREGPSLVLKRRTLPPAEAGDFDARVRRMALELIANLGAGRLGRVEPPSNKAQPLASSELREFLERISRWDKAAWIVHREQYVLTYGLLPFLPPECQNAVVLQATLGHRGGFGCGRAPEAARQVRSQPEFEQHTSAVAALWGRRIFQSRTIFLAGSDVIHLPIDDVKGYLSAIARRFRVDPAARGPGIDQWAAGDGTTHRLDGVHVFLDDFVPPLPDCAGWGELAARGLARVSLGVESGDADVRALYSKTWDNDALGRSVAELKAAGLGVSVLTLVDPGGGERAEPHVTQTARLLESLELGRGDFVFLLDENELRAAQDSPAEMPKTPGFAWLQQQARLKEGLAPLKRRGVKILPYTLEKQQV
jgi:hypothetical protein